MKKQLFKYILRVGMFAKGVIYITVGIISLRVALNGGGDAESTGGALDEIGQQPFGNIALTILALGLLHYAAWRFAQAILDPEKISSEPFGKALRVWAAAVGTGHLYLAYQTMARVIYVWGAGGDESDETVRSWTGRILEWPGGRWLIVALALAALGVCVGQLIYAYKAPFTHALRAKGPGQKARTTLIWLGRAGIGSRSVIAAIIGVFFAHVALTSDPENAGGASDALQTLIQQPFGRWLLGTTALGMLGLGLFFWGMGRYQAVDKQSKS